MINSAKFTERLQKLMRYHDESASSFAEKIGVQRSSISHILSGRNKPSLDFVMKVLHSYPDVELYWLIKGKGVFPSQQNPHHKEAVSVTSEELKITSTKNKTSEEPEIEKIIVFFKDGTFKSYKP